MGTGVARGRPSVFIQAFSSPRGGNSILETCSGVLVPYTRDEVDSWPQWPGSGAGFRLLQVWAPAQSRAGWSLTGSAQPQGTGATSARPL